MAFDTQSTEHQDTTGHAEASQAAGRDVMVPLNKLVLSAKNVRKTHNPKGIPQLAALIASQSLLARLCVTAVEGDPGRFAVEAGGRRLRALELLAGIGEPALFKELADLGVTLRIAVDEPIECKLFESARAVEVSTAENSGREEMHVADQVEAFAALIATGLTDAQVGKRFGVSPLTVQRRMTLAGLEPRFLQLLRDDAIELDQLQALALTDDHAQQVAVWESLPSYQRSAYMIRQALTDDELEGDSALAKFVGLDAYVAAGGPVRSDLFAEAGECWFQDAGLAMKLAMARLEAVAEEERAAGWSWVEAHWSVDYQTLNRFDVERSRPGKLTDEEAKGMEAWKALEEDMRAARGVLERAYREAPSDSQEEADARALLESAQRDAANIREAVAALHEALATWSPKQLSSCGVIVTVNHAGVIDIKRGLMRPEDRKAIVAELTKAGKPVPVHMQSAVPAKGERAAFSERLMLDLTAHRTAALQAALVDNAHVALALVVQRLIEPIVSSHRYHGGSGPLKLSATLTKHTPLESRATEYAETQAAAVLEAAAARVGELVPGTGVFKWLLSQDDAALLDLLAFCAASSLDAMQGRESTTYDATDALAAALNVDMADWWTPTPAKYLNSVSKAQVMEAVTEACGAEAAKAMGSHKKGEAVAHAAAKLAGTRWLPAPLRTKPTPQ